MIWDITAQAITYFPSEVGGQERRTAAAAFGPEDTAGSRRRGHVTDRRPVSQRRAVGHTFARGFSTAVTPAVPSTYTWLICSFKSTTYTCYSCLTRKTALKENIGMYVTSLQIDNTSFPNVSKRYQTSICISTNTSRAT